MTRAEMLAEVRTNLMQSLGPLRDYAGPSEENALDRAADDTAQATDCYFAEQITDLVAGQADYCAPKIYKPKSYWAIDANGNRVSLSRENTRSMDGRSQGIPGGWRQWTARDHPCHVISDGSTTFAVAPVAVADREGGLIIAGFALSTLPKAGHDNHQWDTGDDECPLPIWAHNAVTLRATYLRLRQLAVKEPGALQLAAVYESDWKAQCLTIDVHAVKAYQSIRVLEFVPNSSEGNYG